ncbi:MAG: hypothetical protein LKG27_02710 [Clostridiaceae bacterium]|jgi:hypothetical protein|nr:hypothetical protein [Clostridiaceae bacterium]
MSLTVNKISFQGDYNRSTKVFKNDSYRRNQITDLNSHYITPHKSFFKSVKEFLKSLFGKIK